MFPGPSCLLISLSVDCYWLFRVGYGKILFVKMLSFTFLAQSSYVMSLFTTLFHISQRVLAIFAYDRYLSEGGHTHSQMALISLKHSSGGIIQPFKTFFYRNAQLTSQGAIFLPTSRKNLRVKIKSPKAINSLTIIITSFPNYVLFIHVRKTLSLKTPYS
jgi:hypothetical protein